jgi:hypothetical protein
MALDHPTLIADEGFFLQATKSLFALEAREEKFELVNAVTEFSAEPYVAARFEALAEREIGTEERDAIDYYVAAVYLVSHHRGDIEDLAELFGEFVEPVADFIRTAAWAFLSAWNLRYGGLYSHLLSRHTLIDPTRVEPL